MDGLKDGSMITTGAQFSHFSLLSSMALLGGPLSLGLTSTFADELESPEEEKREAVQFYRSPEERREAGLGTGAHRLAYLLWSIGRGNRVHQG